MTNSCSLVLWRACAKESMNGQCAHAEGQKEIFGVYTTQELKLAVNKRYKVLKIYEAWVFESMYGLFAEYVILTTLRLISFIEAFEEK